MIELPSMSAAVFILVALAVVLLARGSSAPWTRVVRRSAAAIALLAALFALAEFATTGGGPPRIAPVTALALAMSAGAFLLLDVGHAGVLAQMLALATGVLGFLSVVGHASSLPGGTRYSLIPVPTAIALVVLSVGILGARPDRGLMRLVSADTAAGIVVRRLLPVVIGAPLAVAWLVESGRRAGLYGPEFGMALFVVGTVVVLSWVVWWAASALQRMDVQRRRAETARQRADEEVGRAVARTAALTDSNKALVETTSRLRVLERLNRLVSSSLEFEAVLAAIARAAADIMAVPVVSFWVVDELAGTVNVRAWSDAEAGADFPFPTFAIGEGLVGLVAARREPISVPDVFAGSVSLRSREWCERHGLKSFHGVPVLAQGRLLAVLVLSSRTPQTWSDEDQQRLASFVAQAAVAIENARLFADAETRRRAAEAAEARYRELFDRNLAGIIRATPDGRIVDCNEAMVRMLGYRARDEVLALHADDLYVDPSDRRRLLAPLRAGERLGNAELQWRRADGTQLSVLVNIAAFEREGGDVELEGIVVDVTDRERAAVAEREAEALRAVTKLANGVAHEINNPLAVIVAHLDLLGKRHGADPDITQRIGQARVACHRIAEMIAHMGHITRLQVDQSSANLPPILDLRRSSESHPAERSTRS